MTLAWDDTLATGSTVIDHQHRELIAQVASLGLAMKQGKGRDQINKLLDFLGQYVVRHFRDEERLMEEAACPAAAANKEAHQQFLAKYAELRKRLDSTGWSVTLVLEIYDMLSKWLVAHIKGIDARLRECHPVQVAS